MTPHDHAPDNPSDSTPANPPDSTGRPGGPDEVPVPHFEDQLWRTLAQVHAEQEGHPLAPPSEVGEARTRRRARRMILVGVGSVAAAALALTAIVATDSGSGSGGGDTEAADTTPAPDEDDEGVEVVTLAAQITAASQEASATSILHKTTDNQNVADDGTPIGDEESWTDEQSGARRDLSYSSEGEPFYDSGRVTAPTVDDQGPPPIPPDAEPFDPSLPTERHRTVDYCFSEYWEEDQTAIPGMVEADALGEWLEEGSIVEDGTVDFRGRELIRLVQVPADIDPTLPPEQLVPVDPETGETLPTTTTAPPVTDPETGELDPDEFEFVEHIYLVDAETFRPVHIIGYPGQAADYSDAMYIATIEYLPRTPENLAKLVAPVPEGFTRVEGSRGDGERYDACGW
jgi:hypothetical protein